MSWRAISQRSWLTWSAPCGLDGCCVLAVMLQPCFLQTWMVHCALHQNSLWGWDWWTQAAPDSWRFYPNLVDPRGRIPVCWSHCHPSHSMWTQPLVCLHSWLFLTGAGANISDILRCRTCLTCWESRVIKHTIHIDFQQPFSALARAHASLISQVLWKT